MNFSRPGAFDLSALKQQAARPAAPSGGAYVIDITEQNFQSAALEASMKHVVVLSLWSPRSPQSADFNDVLAKVTHDFDGQILLARVDVDANAAIAQALDAKAVPLVVGLVTGQPVPLFQGTVDEAEVLRFFSELVKVAAENGVTGRAQPAGAATASDDEAEEEPADPRFAAADAAFGDGDFPTAVTEYERLLAQYPADTEIAERLAGVKLLARTMGADLQAARKAAADAPDDLEAQMLVADLDVSGGHVDDAFARLIELIKRTAGDERENVRTRLVELFTVVGNADPRVAAARRALASALF